jgi:hypothetical protein
MNRLLKSTIPLLLFSSDFRGSVFSEKTTNELRSNSPENAYRDSAIFVADISFRTAVGQAAYFSNYIQRA